TNFMDLGFDSLLMLQVQQALETATEVTLPPTVLFEHPSIQRLSAHLAEAHGEAVRRHLGPVGPAPATVLPPAPAPPAPSPPLETSPASPAAAAAPAFGG